jgi:hypothetical protein
MEGFFLFIYSIQRGAQRFPVASSQYPTVSMFNCNVDPFNDPQMSCRIGSAYTFFSILERPLRTWSITPQGNTDRADLPYVNALTEVYARAELKPLSFTDAELAENRATERVLDVAP